MEYERVTLGYLDEERFRVLDAKCSEIIKAIETGVGEIADGTVGASITDCIYVMLGEAYTLGKADRSPRGDLDEERFRVLDAKCSEIIKAIETGVGEIADGTVGASITDCIYVMLGEAYTAGKADRSPRGDLDEPEHGS